MRKEKGYTTNDGVDYYHHLIDIAQQLINIGIKDEELITASILQELVENYILEDGTNKYSKETIEDIFNERIANIIEAVTNNSNNEYKENKDLFVEYLEKIKKY